MSALLLLADFELGMYRKAGRRLFAGLQRFCGSIYRLQSPPAHVDFVPDVGGKIANRRARNRTYRRACSEIRGELRRHDSGSMDRRKYGFRWQQDASLCQGDCFPGARISSHGARYSAQTDDFKKA
ncbi:hypothetical protein [Acidithiobacillus thiooxidans]|uniref:hypothetical protein n=1 Tax=Acidithiobacillus thiooxidans TaxID=930 RepID=UPI0004BC1143|nr:hypothetical protein [Acidithiobacillus thiooxidans]